MRERLLGFVGSLRTEGVDVSVAETMDALDAVAAAGVERATLREALAATLVKDERDRACFDRLFDAAFPLGGGETPEAGRGKQRRAGAPGAGGGGGEGEGAAGRRPPREEPDGAAPGARPAAQREGRGAVVAQREPEERGDGRRRSRAARRTALLERPLAELTARDVAEARDLVRELGERLRGRLARRERALRRGRLDIRRTLRAAIASGGVPLRLRRAGAVPDGPTWWRCATCRARSPLPASCCSV